MGPVAAFFAAHAVMLFGGLVATISAINAGMIRVPLPYPATRENFVQVAPPNILPWVWRPIAPAGASASGAAALGTPFVENSRLRETAVRLFKGRVFGSESVTFDPTDPTGSRLVMMDQYGAVWEAKHRPAQGGAGAAAAAAGLGRAAKGLLSSVLGGGGGGKGGSHASSSSLPPSEDEFELSPDPVAWLGAGRPLGAAFRPRTGELVVCDALKGLLSVEKGARRPTLLANHVSSSSSLDPGTPIRYCNDVAITGDGRYVYFTDSVDVTIQRMRLGNGAATAERVAGGGEGSGDHVYDTKTGWAIGMVQARAAGRVLRYDWETGEAVVVARGLRYANGVALAERERWLAVVETDRLRVIRVPLWGRFSGKQQLEEAEAEWAGLGTEGRPEGEPALVADGVELAPELLLQPQPQRQQQGGGVDGGGGGGGTGNDGPRPTVLIQNLPAAPDGLATAADGRSFWLSMVVKMPPVVKYFRPPAVRALVAWLPRALRPAPVRWGGVARLDARSGGLLSFLMDPTGERVATVSAAHEHDGRLYFGNLDLDYVAVAPLTAEAHEAAEEAAPAPAPAA